MFPEVETTTTRFERFLPTVSVMCMFLGVIRDNRFLLGSGLLILAIFGLIWLWWKLSFIGLSSAVHLSEIRAFEGEEIELTISVSNRKILPAFWVNLTYEIPAGLILKGLRLMVEPSTQRASLRMYWSLGPRQTASRTFVIECHERGTYFLGPTQIETGDPVGLFSGWIKQTELTSLIIYPKVLALTPHKLPAQQPFGEARSVGRLFEDPIRTVGVREWRMGDSQRRIHWPVTAKYQALHSRVYEPAEEEQILIFLNIATLEKFWQGTIPALQEQAIRVASSLAFELADKRLGVGFIANGSLPRSDQELRLMPGRAPSQLMLILELLAGVTPFATSSIEELMMAEAPSIPWGTTIVLVTSVIYPDLEATLMDLGLAGRKIVLFLLNNDAKPKRLGSHQMYLDNVQIYSISEFDFNQANIISLVQQT
ncbi:MAG: DUF58 domain-containing protein [Chloroflexota bacterium]